MLLYAKRRFEKGKVNEKLDKTGCCFILNFVKFNY